MYILLIFIMSVAEQSTKRRTKMDLVIHFPDEMRQHLQEQSDTNEFVVRATQIALEEQVLAQRLAKSAAQADRGEYADPKKLEAFFNKWSDDESSMVERRRDQPL